MTQRFGSIYSLLSSRDYRKLVDIWYKSLDYGIASRHDEWPEDYIDGLESMTGRQILEMVEDLQWRLSSMSKLPTRYGKGHNEVQSPDSVLELRQMSADIHKIKYDLMAKLRRA